MQRRAALGFEHARRRESGRGLRACATQPISGFVPLSHAPSAKHPALFSSSNKNDDHVTLGLPLFAAARRRGADVCVPCKCCFWAVAALSSLRNKASRSILQSVRKLAKCPQGDNQQQQVFRKATPNQPAPQVLRAAQTAIPAAHLLFRYRCPKAYVIMKSRSTRACSSPWHR